jgi:ribosomal subunit interface protein
MYGRAQEVPLDLVLKGRGIRITDQMKKKAEAKLAKIEQIDPRVSRLEVEVVLEHNPRIDANHQVEVACTTGRRVIRAHAAGQDLEGALDQVIQRLERQLITYRGKLRSRRQAGPIS